MKVADLKIAISEDQLYGMMDEITKLKIRVARLESPALVNAGDRVQWRHDTMPNGMWRHGIAEAWDWERELWQVRDDDGFLILVACDEANILRAKV